MAIYMGVDIGGTAIKIGLLDSCGHILIKDEFPLVYNKEVKFVELVVKNISKFFETFCRDKTVIGIGISSPGQIDPQLGKVIGCGGHLPNWIGTQLSDIIFKIFKLPCTVFNDANCALLAEKWKGAAQNKKNALLFTVGTGIGGSALVNSEILLGNSGFAGEFGHFPVYLGDKKLQKCKCGSRGCFGGNGSTKALVNSVNNNLSYIFGNNHNIEKVDGRFVFQELKNKNVRLEEIVDLWIDDIATGISGFIHIFNPELIIIGGGVSKQKEFFIEPLKNKIFNKILPAFRHNLDIVPAVLYNDAGMTGAVYYHINRMTK